MTDFRAYLKPRPRAMEEVLGINDSYNIMQPLYDTNGLLFPYTPTIMQFGGNANYDDFKMTHTNYSQPVYKSSEVRDIALSAKFTAQTKYEAQYVLAMLRMMASVTKMKFGERGSNDFTPNSYNDSGLPPPILLFSYMGTHMFNDVPVVVTSYAVDFPDDVDYVKVLSAEGEYSKEEVSYVPAELTLSLELKPYYNPKMLRQSFDMVDFSSGDMIRGKYHGSSSGLDDHGSGYL